jgi:PAS domain S-box-containing protein
MKSRDRNGNTPPEELDALRAKIGELESECAAKAEREDCLRRERDLFGLLMETADAYFVAIDAEGRIVRMNEAMLSTTGYTLEEVKGRDYAELILPDDDARKRFRRTMTEILEGEASVRSENTIRSDDGEARSVHWHGRPFLNESGEMEYFFGVGIDVTEHRHAERKLLASQGRAQQHLELAGVVFLGLDTRGKVTSINRQGCELLGGREEEILGLNWFDTFIPERARQSVKEVFLSLVADELDAESDQFENVIVTLGGEKRVIEWHNAVERDSDGVPIGTMSSGIDITDRKRAEDVQRLAYRISSSVHNVESVQELFGRIQDALGEVMNTENFFIALHNRKRDTLSLSYFVDEKDQDDFDSFPAGKTLTGWIIKHDTSLLIDRQELDEWTKKGIVDMVGTPSLVWLGVPLRVKGEVIGALVVQSYTDRTEFGEADKEMLEFVSEQIGFAIEHRRAEDELQTSEAKNRAILDALPDMIFRLSKDGKFLSYDAAGDEDLAVPPETFLGKHVREVFPEPFAGQIETCAERALKTGEIQLMEYALPVPMPDGDMRDFEARMVLSGDGTVLSVVRDITESKRADKFLRILNVAALGMERQTTPDQLFTAASDELAAAGVGGAIFLTEDNGDSLRLVFTSLDLDRQRSAGKLIGMPMSELPLRIDDAETLRRVVRERETVFVANVVDYMREALPLPKKKFAAQLQRAVGFRKIILAPLIADDRVFGALEVNSDELTERDVPAITAFANQLSAAWRKAMLLKELELSLQELRETQDQLLQAQKMEAVGRLAGGVAHDFNNLLTAISGYAELLSCDDSLSQRAHDDVDQVRKAAEQAAALTRQLLAFSRRQPLQPVVMDLNKIVVDMEAMLRRLISEDIELVTVMGDTACQTKVDPGQLEQVIINLAVNARDAMPEGGKLTIATKEVTLDERACAAIHDARPGSFVCLSIEDTGSGIEREVIDQIFEPFFSTKGPTKGTGLGLAVVYGIIRQHGGWINVYSEPNQGTAFKVYLPSVGSAQTAPADGAAESATGAARGTGQRILLVEDEEAVRNLASRALRENGYTVFEAGAYEEAIELFERERGKFDLIFSDIVLPDKSGIRLIDDLLSRRPGLRVLVSSGYTDQKSQWPVIQEKGFRFLQKPYSIVDLLGTIDELV